MTASLKRLSFARICVEIGFDDSLPNSLDLVLADGSIAEILIDYNWVPKKCSICKVFGHLPKNCKKRPHQVWVPKDSPRPSSPIAGGDQLLSTGSDVPADSALLPGRGSVKPQLALGGSGPSSSAAAPFSSGSGTGSSSTCNAFAPLLDLDVAHIKQGEGSLDQPSARVVACPSPILMDVPDDRSCMEASPIGSARLSSPSSSSSTPPLAKRLISVDELEKKQGKQSKNKKKGRSAGISKGKNLSDFG